MRNRLVEDLMNDPGQTYFVAGMHDAVITELSRIEALRVISRTSAARFRDSGKSVPEIAQELGAEAVVEGSVLKAGDMIRINVQLIEAKTDRHLWAETFDRQLSDINDNTPPFAIALVHLGLGNDEQALDWLEQSFEAKDSQVIYINCDPRFDALRTEPRFIRMLEKIDYPPGDTPLGSG